MRRLAFLAVFLVLIGAAPADATPITVVMSPFQAYQVQQHPPTFALAQDGSIGLQHLRWTGWGTPRAVGTGTGLYRLWPAYKFKRAHGEVTLTNPRTIRCTYQQAGVAHHSEFKVYLRARAVVGPRTVSLKLSSPGC